MIVSRRCSALSQWFLLCVPLMFAAEAAAGDHGSGLAWQNDKDGQPNLVWEGQIRTTGAPA